MDPLDVDLEDAELLGEVELTAALIVAANQADSQLATGEIDRILGLTGSATDTGVGADDPDADDPDASAPEAAQSQ